MSDNETALAILFACLALIGWMFYCLAKMDE